MYKVAKLSVFCRGLAQARDFSGRLPAPTTLVTSLQDTCTFLSKFINLIRGDCPHCLSRGSTFDLPLDRRAPPPYIRENGNLSHHEETLMFLDQMNCNQSGFFNLDISILRFRTGTNCL